MAFLTVETLFLTVLCIIVTVFVVTRASVAFGLLGADGFSVV